MAWKFFKADGSLLTSIGTTADVATTVTVSDNESTNENNVLTFVAGADADGGNVGLESDGDLYYNPSSGTLTSPAVTISGTLDVNGTIDYDGCDVDVLSTGDIDLVSSANAAAAIYIAQSTGTSGTIKIHADTGTSVTEGAESINILSDVGGVGIRSTANLANAINLTSDGGTTGSIAIFNDQGTSVTEGAASISLLSDAGGVELRSTANLANAINLTVDGGTTSSMTLFNDQGTSVTEGSASIALVSDAGGVELRSTADLANAINLTSDGGTSGTITLFNDQGTAVNEGVASIQLLSDVGGIGIKSGLDAAGAIRLTADAGTSETIILHSDLGTGEGSITLTSDAGGIDLNAAAGKDIALDSGQVLVTATHNTACTIYLHANGGTSETIKIHSDQGTSVTEGAASISLLSDAGGVELRSTANLVNAINLTSDGGTTGTISIFNDLGTTSTEGAASIQLLSDVGGIGIKSGLNAAGAIRLTADAGTSETIILHSDLGTGAASICLTSDAGGITLAPSSAVTVSGALTVGVCGTGHDVKFFGCLAGAYMLYDESEEQLEIRGASADASTSTGKLLLSTALTNINANDVIGSINFQAPAEAGGTDAIAIAAGIRAIAQATFTCAVNATDLIFYTGHSEAATEKFRFTSQGEIGVGGTNYGTDGQVLTSAGAGAAVAWECAGGGISLEISMALFG
jgi:hypothetical protein